MYLWKRFCSITLILFNDNVELFRFHLSSSVSVNDILTVFLFNLYLCNYAYIPFS